MKTLYLVRKLYSKYLIREVVLMILIAYLIFALTIVVAPFAYMISLQNDILANINHPSIYFQPFERVQNMLDGFLFASEKDVQTMNMLLEESINSIEGVIGQGKTSDMTFTNDEQDAIRILGYNDDMIKYCSLPLKNGRWFDTIDREQMTTLPVVIGGLYRDIYQVGDSFDLKIDITDSVLNCSVIGVLDDQDTYFNLGYGSTAPGLNSIAVMNKWLNMGEISEKQYILIAPLDKMNFVTPYDISKSRMLFFENGVEIDKLAESLQANGEYGNYYAINTLYDNEINVTLILYKNEVVLSIVLFLFGIFGLGGYTLLTHSRNEAVFGIYFLCGMKKRTAILISLVATIFLVLIPSAVMTMLAPVYVKEMAQTGGITYLICLAVITAIMIISSLISIIRISRIKLIRLYKGADLQ